MALQKNYVVKIFGQDGTTLKKSVSRKSLRTNPSFRCRINGGFGECVLDLVGTGFAFDNFGEGTWIAHSYIVDIYEVDSVNAPLGRRIYRGYISKYEPYIDASGQEGVKVTCLGLVSLLTKSYYKNGSSFTVTQSGVDPQAIGEAIIDHYNTIFGGSLLSYTHGTSTQTVGTNVSYTFTDQKWFDALTTVAKLAGTNWWWKIDENGLYSFQAKPSSATHKFTIRKDVNAITAPKDAEKVINDVQVRRSGGTASNYSDATSQSTYGTGATPSGKYSAIINDPSITDANGADQRGNKEVNDKKTAFNSAVITVNPNYDLESIKCGQTCRVMNYDKSSTFFGTNLLIVGLAYDGDTCRVEVERSPADFGLELNTFVNG